MLRLVVPAVEQFDEIKNEFITTRGIILTLEHSLVSLSKWESKWCKPFLSKEIKTEEETRDYIVCMTITQNVPSEVYEHLDHSLIKVIDDYIGSPMTATIITNKTTQRNREVITSELIYYWMIALNIPFECQKWHLNRLLTLINVCSIKNTPAKKMSRREVMSRNAELNAARRRALNTSG